MILVEMKCGMCGHRFEVKLIDRDDPREENLRGSPIRCEKCRHSNVEVTKRLQRLPR